MGVNRDTCPNNGHDGAIEINVPTEAIVGDK